MSEGWTKDAVGWPFVKGVLEQENEELRAEVERLRAIIMGVHGVLVDAEDVQVPDNDEPIADAVRSILDERNRLRAYLPLARAAAAWSAAFVDTDDPYNSEMAVHLATDALTPEQQRALMEDK